MRATVSTERGDDSESCEGPDAAQIARQLTEKYGIDALTFAEERAQRAIEIGDEFALRAWHDVIAATRSLLSQVVDA
jgi:hypothetical protein